MAWGARNLISTQVEKAEDVLHSLSRKRGVLRVKVAAKLHGTQQGLWHEDKHGGFLIGESSPYGVTSKLVDEVAEHERLGDFHPNDPGRCFVVTTTDADVTAATMCDQWRNCQAPKNYQWLCDAELEFSNGQKVCEAFRGSTKLAVTFHKVQGRYLVVPALLDCGCDLTRDCGIVEDDAGWRATCKRHGNTLDLLKLLPGIAHCQGKSHELYVAREGYEPRPQKSFAELIHDTGLTQDEQEDYPLEPEEDLGPQKLPTFQEIVTVLRKYIPEEDRPWDTVDYEEVKEGAPYPERPPPQKPPPSEARCDASKVFQETLDHLQKPKLPWSSGVFKGLSEEGVIDHATAEKLFPGPPSESFAEAHHDPPKPPVVPPSQCPLSLMVQPPSSKVVVEDVPAVDEDALMKEAAAWKAKGPNRTSSPLRPPTPPTPPAAASPTPQSSPAVDSPAPTPSPPPAPSPAPTPAFDYSRFDKLNVSDSDDEAQEHAHEFVDEVLKEGRKLFSDGPPGSPPAPAPAPAPAPRRRVRAPAPAPAPAPPRRARARAAPAPAPAPLRAVADEMGASSSTNDFEFDDDGDAFVGAVGPSLTRAQVDGFRVVDLKKELAARGLKTSGLKAVLKARLLEALGLPAS